MIGRVRRSASIIQWSCRLRLEEEMTTEPCNWNQYKLVSTETDRDGMTIADGSPALPIPSRPTLLLIYGFCCHTHRRKERVWVLYAKSDQVERREERKEKNRPRSASSWRPTPTVTWWRTSAISGFVSSSTPTAIRGSERGVHREGIAEE